MVMREMTRAELATYNGRDGQPTYVAYKGLIYDVSSSPQWEEGEHLLAHGAGDDLTEQLQYAPHGEEVLARFPVVGILVEEADIRSAQHRGAPL
jgi:predicted heme/steroid binding protein